MDPFDTPLNRQKCQDTYGYLESDSASDKTIVWTLVLILCTILLEVFANGRLDCCDSEKKKPDEEEAASLGPDTLHTTAVVTEQPEIRLEPEAGPQAVDGTDNSDVSVKATESNKQDGPSCAFCCSEDPTPQVRANRLAVSTLLFGVACIAFALRIEEATAEQYVDFTCWRIIHPTPPNWTAITFLNIIPFICASFAFLRTLVDSLLVRWGRGLSYEFKDGQCFWTPLMPFMIVLCAGYLLFECVKVPIACLMGNREVSLWTAKRKDKGKAEEIEMQGEEAQGLVEHMDGNGEPDDEDASNGLPAYDEVCSDTRPMEGKPTANSMV